MINEINEINEIVEIVIKHLDDNLSHITSDMTQSFTQSYKKLHNPDINWLGTIALETQIRQAKLTLVFYDDEAYIEIVWRIAKQHPKYNKIEYANPKFFNNLLEYITLLHSKHILKLQHNYKKRISMKH